MNDDMKHALKWGLVCASVVAVLCALIILGILFPALREIETGGTRTPLEVIYVIPCDSSGACPEVTPFFATPVPLGGD